MHAALTRFYQLTSLTSFTSWIRINITKTHGKEYLCVNAFGRWGLNGLLFLSVILSCWPLVWKCECNSWWKCSLSWGLSHTVICVSCIQAASRWSPSAFVAVLQDELKGSCESTEADWKRVGASIKPMALEKSIPPPRSHLCTCDGFNRSLGRERETEREKEIEGNYMPRPSCLFVTPASRALKIKFAPL